MLLHSDIPIDSIEQDGVMDILFSREEWYEHHHYWYKYLMNHYLDNENMKKVVRSHNRIYFLFIQECLNQYHDVIFLDITDLDEEEKYTCGMLFLPSSITNKQYSVLKENLHYFKQFSSLIIEGGCEIIDIWKTEECTISDDIEGRVFPYYLEETIQELVHSKHK